MAEENMNDLPILYKVDINPSYEWAKEAEGLGVSHRELEVLALVVEGYKNKEIGKILKIQHQSVKNHLQNLFKKLDAKNNTQAYILAINLNMIRMRAAFEGITGVPPTEVTRERFIEDLRKVVSGEMEVEGFGDKDRQRLKVWLRQHGSGSISERGAGELPSLTSSIEGSESPVPRLEGLVFQSMSEDKRAFTYKL